MPNRIFEYEEPLPRFSWKIDSAKRTLAGYVCHKAQTTYAGRDWVVWFAPDIPFDAAPWKFNGLPGAVLEAYDSKRHFHFSICGIEQVEQPIVRYEIRQKRCPARRFGHTNKKFTDIRSILLPIFSLFPISKGMNLNFYPTTG